MRREGTTYARHALAEFHSMWDTRFGHVLSWIDNHHRSSGPDFFNAHQDPDVVIRSIYGWRQDSAPYQEMKWLLLLYHNQQNGFLGTRSLVLHFLPHHINQRGLIGTSLRGVGYGSALERATESLLRQLSDRYQLPIHRIVINDNQKSKYELDRILGAISDQVNLEQRRWQSIYSSRVSPDYVTPCSFVYPDPCMEGAPLPRRIDLSKPSHQHFR